MRRECGKRYWLGMAFVWLLHIIAVLQISSLAHVVEDAVHLALGVPHAPDGDDDDPNHECPPGCATCHHVHYAANAAAPEVLGPTELLIANVWPSAVPMGTEHVPPSVSLSGPDKPPRT